MQAQERQLTGTHFVFFGGSTGMGKAAALAVGKRGASVLIVGRDRAAGEAAAQAVRAAGAPVADFISGDLSTVAGVASVADAVRAWRPTLHGVMHTAMTASRERRDTPDGLEFSFALQYLARAALNRLLLDRLAASGDGRIVHIGGDVPPFIKVDLNDLQFHQRKWGFMKSILGTHVLGALHIQRAAQLWADLPVTIAASCVGTTNTKAMADPQMPWYMRLMGRFGAAPEVSAKNAIEFLTTLDAASAKGATLRNPNAYKPEAITRNQADAEQLWAITTKLALDKGLVLP